MQMEGNSGRMHGKTENAIGNYYIYKENTDNEKEHIDSYKETHIKRNTRKIKMNNNKDNYGT